MKCPGQLLFPTLSSLDLDTLEAGFEHARKADLCLAMGSSLTVTPAADIPEVGDHLCPPQWRTYMAQVMLLHDVYCMIVPPVNLHITCTPAPNNREPSIRTSSGLQADLVP